MTTEHSGPTEEGPPAEVYRRLASACPAERAEVVLRLIAADPRRRLVLPAGDAGPAVLEEVDFDQAAEPPRLDDADLRGARLRKAGLRGLDLSRANLSDAALGEADLRGCRLEGADLERADLAGADLRDALLGKAGLRGALLEEADLRGARLRFADLRGAALENANLRGADLWGANLEDAVLIGADLRGATFKECSLRGANLTGANLEGATIEKADLTGARLKNALLPGVVLETSTLTHVHLGGVWLDRTRLRGEQLGGAIGEELAGEYDEATHGYLALERNFTALGDPDGSGWAYRRRRRMQKLASLGHARAAFAAGDWRAAAGHAAGFASDQFVEWLCDYGESVPRVLASMLVLHLAFTLLYGVTGSVVRVGKTPLGEVRVPTWNVVDLMTFSLLALSTSGSPAVGLQPRNESVHFLTAAEALAGIALTGLLGFVVGNRIRR